MTCTIGGLTANGTAATVVWKDPDDKVVTDDDNYDINNGTPDGSGTQSAELTIKTAKLAAEFASQSSFTYKCSVKSALYPDSPISSDVNVEANVLKLGNILSKADNCHTTGAMLASSEICVYDTFPKSWHDIVITLI